MPEVFISNKECKVRWTLFPSPTPTVSNWQKNKNKGEFQKLNKIINLINKIKYKYNEFTLHL